MKSKTPRKSPKNVIKVESNKKEISPEKRMEIVYIKRDDFETPSKLNNDLVDASMLDHNEVIEMLHDTDNILDLDNIPFLNNSIMNFSTLDENLNNQSSTLKSPPDPLSLDNENISDSKEIDVKPKRRGRRKRNSRKTSKTPDNKCATSFSDDQNEKIFNDLEKIKSEEVLSSRIIDKLENLEIKLTHVVPPQHKVEISAGTRSLTEKENKKFDELSHRLKCKFNEQEDNIIKQNWKLFCKNHKWNEKDVQCFFCPSKSLPIGMERKKFVQFLGKGLPYRTLFSINQRFKYLFTKNIVIGRFTPEEDDKIMTYMKNRKRNLHAPFSELSKLLCRSRLTIYRRYKILKNIEDTSKKRKKQKSRKIRKIVWTLKLTERFLKNLMKITLSRNIKQLENEIFPHLVWIEMEKKMNIGNIVLRNFWLHKLHLQLFSPVTIFMNDIKIKLIEYLHLSAITNPKNINWTDVSNLFVGTTTFFLCDVTYRLVRHAKIKCNSENFVAQIEHNLAQTLLFEKIEVAFLTSWTLVCVIMKNVNILFAEIVNYMYEVMIPCLKMNEEDKYLPKLNYENGQLMMLDEDEEIDYEESLNEEDNLIENSCGSLRNLSAKEVECEDEIECQEKQKTIWTLSLREKFLKLLLEMMIFKDIRELKDAEIPAVVWKKMENKYQVPREELKKLWFNELHLQLFSPNSIYLNDLKIKLIELIYKKQFKSEEEINWDKICNSFDGFTTSFLSQLFIELSDSAAAKINSSKFSEIVNYMHDVMIPCLKMNEEDKYLPKLYYENGKLTMLDEDEEIDYEESLNEKDNSIENSCGSIRNLSEKEVECEEKIECQKKQEIIWTLSLREEFLKLLLEMMIFKDIRELKDAVIPAVVWKKMENKFQVHPEELKNLWFNELHLQLFSPSPIYLNDLKIKLIELIYKKQFKSEEEINWDKICNSFDGCTTSFLSQLFIELSDSAAAKINSSKFSDIMKYLYENMFLKLKNGQDDKFLPRIIFENNKIEVIDEEFDNDAISKRNENVEFENGNKREIYSTLSSREKFLKLLLCLTLNTEIEELKDAEIPLVVWEEMDNQLKIDKSVLQNLWYKELHLQLFSSNPIYLNDIKMNLIELIYKKEVRDQNEISWSEISSHFDGVTTVFLSQIFSDLVDSAVEEIGSSTFSDIMKFLYQTVFIKLKNGKTDQSLPQIKFENIVIKVKAEEFENYETVINENYETFEKEKNLDTEIESKTKIFSTLYEREQFLKLLLSLTISSKIEELKDAEIPLVVWKEMEKQLKVDESVLQDLWYKELHLQLFSSYPIYLSDIKMNLIKLVYKKKITNQQDINWNELCFHFDGVTAVFLSQIFTDLVNFVAKEIEFSNFCDIMKYLYEKMFLKFKNEQDDKFLPRIIFENNEIKVIDEEFELATCKEDENLVIEVVNKSEIFSNLSSRENFLKLLLRLTLNTRIEELKDAEIPLVVWKKMEKQLKVDKSMLQDLWYKELHLQLFSANPVYLNDIKMILIKLIHEKEITDEKEINWNEICSHFDGMTVEFLSQVFQELVDLASRNIDTREFFDIMNYLYKTTFNELKKVPVDKLLPRIIFNNEKMSIVTKKSDNASSDKGERKLNNSSEHYENIPETR